VRRGLSTARSTERMKSIFVLACLCVALSGLLAPAQQTKPNTVTIHWDKVIAVSRTTPTLQIVVNPMTRPGSPIHDSSFAAVRALGADYVRYVPWMPYPKLVVAELEPPTASKTSWDFSLIDPMTKDFFESTDGHTRILNFSTIPAWLFKSDKPVTYPTDPNQVAWDYTQGTELRDPSGKELGDYYARLVSWYAHGGFTDEHGIRHDSGYHFDIPIWEVLNEPDFEHETTPKQYTERYDAIVSAIHRVSPETKFMALALAMPSKAPEQFEYFLNPRNHKSGIPLDYISYHFYASPSADQTIDDWQYTFFDQVDGFLNTVRYIEAIRKRLSPQTKTDLNELGSILADGAGDSDHLAKSYPEAYWNLSGSLYAYLFIELAKQQIDIIGESQLVGYPSQFPSVTMVDWTTGKPNARFWALKLLKDSFRPGDTLVDTAIAQGDVAAQAFITPAGHKLLLINKRNHAIDVRLPDAANAVALAVDPESAYAPARSVKIADGEIKLEPFSVTVVSW
jgi:Glycosyl hydrolases family 39